MEIADSVLDLIGNTPLVRLRRVVDDISCPVVAKVEITNPGGSAKDRPALAMILAAEEAGLIKPGGTIVEPTSGNTGVGLAIVAAQRGYKCVFVTTDKVGPEKISLLEAYGAEVIVCPVAVAPDDPQSYYSTAARLAKEIPDAFRPDQYSNLANPQAHYDTTGPEIWRQTDGKVTHFVCGVGTGGTISGIGRYLKEQNPDVKIVAADPQGSVYSGGSGRPYLVEGVGEDFWPATYDTSVVDMTIAVSDADSFRTARRVSREEGLLIGGSCGTAVAAALQVASGCTDEHLVVVLIPDSGRGYLSTVFNDKWMATFGFITSDGAVVGDVLGGRRTNIKNLEYVQPEDSVRSVIGVLRGLDISQIPVAKGEWPLSAAEVVGSLDELHLMERAFEDEGLLDRQVSEVMQPPLTTIGIGQPVHMAVEKLDSCQALLVLDGGRPHAVITRSDLLRFVSPEES